MVSPPPVFRFPNTDASTRVHVYSSTHLSTPCTMVRTRERTRVLEFRYDSYSTRAVPAARTCIYFEGSGANGLFELPGAAPFAWRTRPSSRTWPTTWPSQQRKQHSTTANQYGQHSIAKTWPSQQRKHSTTANQYGQYSIAAKTRGGPGTEAKAAIESKIAQGDRAALADVQQPLTNRHTKFVVLAFESSGWTDPTVQKLDNVWEQQASRRLGPDRRCAALVAGGVQHQTRAFQRDPILELGFPHPAALLVSESLYLDDGCRLCRPSVVE
jgi:hypothetical protein